MILSDKDLLLLNTMPSSSEPDSSNSQNDLTIGTIYNLTPTAAAAAAAADQHQVKVNNQLIQMSSSSSPFSSLEFDGTTVLCRVCGDKASGFHYGVHSCEGCKGFFRRSIQQKIQYRPCTKNQQCSILRINRNRCQYCRLKKCIAVGMSRDAVRFGRVPKREKAKILAAMQKVNMNSMEKLLNAQLEDENRLLSTILQAHDETCDYTKDKVAPLVERARSQPVFAACSPQMACPFNPMPQKSENGSSRIMEDFSELFTPAIAGVVQFARRIPGFAMLSQDDQATLLKAGVFEVLLVRLACMFDSQTNSMICLNGLVLKREALHTASNARFLMDSMFDFAERMNSLRLTDNEIALFCAVVVIAPDRPGLRNIDLVQRIHRKLDSLLQKSVTANHPENVNLFCELKKKIPDLRTLNTLHSEKLLAYKMEPRIGSSVATTAVASSTSTDTSTVATVSDSSNGSNGTSNVGNSGCDLASLLPDRWHSLNLLAAATSGQNSPNGSDYDMSYGSPRSVSSSVMSTDDQSIKSPPRSASASSAKSNGYINGSDNEMVRSHLHSSPYSPASAGDSRCPKRSASSMAKTVSSTSGAISNTEHGCSSGDESYYAADSPVKSASSSHNHSASNFSKIRRVDSPTDSGIESGKEHCSGSTPTTSVCSSPRSALEDKVKDVSDSESNEKQESIDDMPMLKRALQAPPLINSNMLMDEAYRHHKKFRATKREGSSPSPSTTTPSESPLASSHSTLVKSLEQAPRFLNEQQLKRSDLIHNIIMRSESSLPSSSSSSSSSESRYQSPLNVSAHHNSTFSKGSSVLMTATSAGNYSPASFSSACPYTGQQVSRIMYTGSSCGSSSSHSPSSMQSDVLSQRRSPAHLHPHSHLSPLHHSPLSHHLSSSSSPVALVMGPSSQPKPCLSPMAASLPLSSPVNGVAIKMSQSSDLLSDSQPLNLSMSKRVSTPNSPTVTVKMESS